MKNILTVLVLACSLLFSASAGVITVSDPGQPSDQTTQSDAVAEYTRVRITIRDVEFYQSIFLILERRGQTFVKTIEGELFYGRELESHVPISEQMIIGPFNIFPETNGTDISIWAKVSRIETYLPNDPPVLGLDVTGIAVHGYTTITTNVTFEGAFPLRGSTHWIWTNQTPPVARIEKLRLGDWGGGQEFFRLKESP